MEGKLGLEYKAGARVLALDHGLSLVLTLVVRDLAKRNGIEALWLPQVDKTYGSQAGGGGGGEQREQLGDCVLLKRAKWFPGLGFV